MRHHAPLDPRLAYIYNIYMNTRYNYSYNAFHTQRAVIYFIWVLDNVIMFKVKWINYNVFLNWRTCSLTVKRISTE